MYSKKVRSLPIYKSPEYMAWGAMKDRCLRPRSHAYKNYGGRGITICQEWIDSFEAFFDHIGERPSPKHSLGRIDNSKGYEPGNVRWETRPEQHRNTRRNRLIEFNGVTRTLAEWARSVGVTPTVLSMRLDQYGWTVESALSTPLQKGKSHTGETLHRKRMISHNGETLSIQEWARRANVSAKTIASRIDRYRWPLEKALFLPENRGVPLDRRETVTFHGETLSYSEWAKRTGLRRELIWERINRYGWTAEKALTTR